MGIKNREGALVYATGIDNRGLRKGKAEATGILKGLTKNVTGMDVFAGLGISAGLAFGKIISEAFQFTNEFGSAMKEVQTISDAVEADFNGMSDSVLDILQDIPAEATESAKALYQIVSAGYDGAAGLNLLEVSAKAAVGGITDTATAADGITTILNAFNLGAENAEKVSDILFTTVKRGKTTFGELSHSIAQVAPLAASFGISFEELAGAIATLTKSGTTTETAMVQIRGAILKVNDVLGDGAFKGRSMQEAFNLVRESAGGSQDALKKLVPDARALLGVLGLTGDKARTASEDLDAMSESTGAAEKAFETMLNEFDNQSKLLGNKITKNILEPLGSALMDLAMNVMPQLQTELDAAGDDSVPFWGKLIAFLTPGVYAKDFQTEYGKLTDYAKKQSEKMFEDIKSKAGDSGFTKEFVDDQINQTDILWKKYTKQVDEAVKRGNEIQIEGAKRDAYTAYDLLEKLKKARKKFNSDDDDDSGSKDPVITPLINIKKFEDDIKELKKKLKTADAEEAVKIQLKIDNSEQALEDFKEGIENAVRRINDNKDGSNSVGVSLGELESQVTLSKKQTKEYKKQSKELDKMNSTWVKNARAAQDTSDETKKLTNQFLDIADISSELAGLAANFDGELANVLDTVGAIATGSANIAQGFAPDGNVAQGIAGGVQILSSLAGTIFGGGGDTESFSDAMDRFVSSLNSAQEALDKLSGRNFTTEIGSIDDAMARLALRADDLSKKGKLFGGFLKPFKGLQSDIIAVEDLDAAIAELSNKIISGTLGKKASNNAQELLDAYIALKEEIEAITKELTGTTGGELADALVEAFNLGKGAVEDWGQTTEDVIRNVIIKQLKSQLLIKPIQEAIDKLTRDAADNGLSTGEATSFIDAVNALQSDYSSAFSELNKVFADAGIDLTGAQSDAANGISGAIRAQLTEETGSELVGLWNRTSIDIRGQLNTQKDMAESLINIEAHTLRSAETLERIEDKLENNSSSSTKRDLGY